MKTAKRTSFLAIMATAAIFSFFACRKEVDSKSPSTTTTVKAPNTSTGVEKVPPIGGTLVLGSRCGGVQTCTTLPPSIAVTRNMITFTKNSSTVLYFPDVRYTVYRQNGTSTTYDKVAEFNCNASTVQYASATLPNNTNFYLVLTTPDAPAMPLQATYIPNWGTINVAGTAIAFTTGNGAGIMC